MSGEAHGHRRRSGGDRHAAGRRGRVGPGNLVTVGLGRERAVRLELDRVLRLDRRGDHALERRHLGRDRGRAARPCRSPARCRLTDSPRRRGRPADEQADDDDRDDRGERRWPSMCACACRTPSALSCPRARAVRRGRQHSPRGRLPGAATARQRSQYRRLSGTSVTGSTASGRPSRVTRPSSGSISIGAVARLCAGPPGSGPRVLPIWTTVRPPAASRRPGPRRSAGRRDERERPRRRPRPASRPSRAGSASARRARPTRCRRRAAPRRHPGLQHELRLDPEPRRLPEHDVGEPPGRSEPTWSAMPWMIAGSIVTFAR